jgi:hypothetical protein
MEMVSLVPQLDLFWKRLWAGMVMDQKMKGKTSEAFHEA